MKFDFDTFPDRRQTESDKWNRYPADVLPMWVADMDFVSPPGVIAALQERVAHGIFGYPDSSLALRQVIAERMAALYNWQVQPDEVVLQPGVVTAFNLACQTTQADQGAVLVQTPVYPPILSAPAKAGLLRQENVLVPTPETDADCGYGVDFAAFEAAITPQTCLFLLCNPHNPVGKVFRRDELERMAEICLRYGVLICSDEIHCDLVFGGRNAGGFPGQRHIPLVMLDPEIARHTITLMAPSKTFNIAGLKCAFAIIQDPELRQRYCQADRGLTGWVNVLGLTAALAAYRTGQEWLDELLVYLQANRDYLLDYVHTELPGIKMNTPEGTYLAWLDCREVHGVADPYHFFLEKAKVALNDGKTFGRGGEGFVRLNFGCPRAMLVQALDQMRDALSKV